MMSWQARWSAVVVGYDTRMIAGTCACFTSTQPIHPTITNRTSTHYAEALGEVARCQAPADNRRSVGRWRGDKKP
jgi:hypothetical protein